MFTIVQGLEVGTASNRVSGSAHKFVLGFVVDVLAHLGQ